MNFKKSVKILAIESSCDETACAVVESGRRVFSSIIASQIEIHKLTGGVVPEVAAREHVLKVRGVVEEALFMAGNLKLSDIDAIAATRGPGLLSSLVIGYCAAATLSKVLDKPFIPVHHVAGHIFANWLDLPENEDINYPVIALTVSGGHNELVLMRKENNFELIGETRDDAAGEAFDKVARLLGLGYPGGPAISKAALSGNPHAINFPRAMLNSGDFDFSFSGLKTAVLREIENYKHLNPQAMHSLDSKFISDCAASFQECVCDILSEKLIRAAKKFNVMEIHLAGGVSANSRLREMTMEKINALRSEHHISLNCKKDSNSKDSFLQEKSINSFSDGSCLYQNIRLRYSKNLNYCTDNAAMIGAAAYYQLINSSDPVNEFPSFPKVFPDPQLNLYK